LLALAEAFPRRRAAGEAFTLAELRDAVGQRLTAVTYRALSPELGLPNMWTIQKVAIQHETSFGQLVRDEAAARAPTVRYRRTRA
jgi:hypothetical protein